MSKIRAFLIGRYPDCDLILDDSSVSRRHAEVVPVSDGRYYITDRDSSGGTFVYSDQGWRPIRQDFVNSADRLRFGSHEIPTSRLESLRVLAGGGGSATDAAVPVQGAVAGGNASEKDNDGLDPNKGLMRNPETGDVIEQS